MEGVFTGIERAALPKRATCSDFARQPRKVLTALPGADLCRLRLLGDLHHVISIGLPRPNDLVRHGCRKSRAPKRALRSVAQFNASGWCVKPPSPGGCFVHDI